MTNLVEFKPFGKIPRWSGQQHIVITEKIDGTNAQIVINDDCTELRVGSRNRWITPDDDNFGFARFVYDNKEAFLRLGKGQHFGEWWGSGIQRGYGITEKRFSLFNTLRWNTPEQKERLAGIPNTDVVPVLYHGPMYPGIADEYLNNLRQTGSHVSPFMDPEGIIIYMPESRTLFKYTYDNRHKGEIT